MGFKSFTLKAMKFLDVAMALILLVTCFLCLVSYIMMGKMAPELREASNFGVSSWMFLITMIFSLAFCLIGIFFVFNWFVLSTNADHVIISELIYILGLEPGLERKDGDGSEHNKTPPAILSSGVNLSDADSIESIYGFGHDKDQKWTYAGR